ncbi:MAG TPA: glycosyltransferase family 4 protein [Terriglobales bacterium]|nr:glycosyltransferase family 4 protein [Terriglobales bacterium]
MAGLSGLLTSRLRTESHNRPWRVLHACELASDAAALAESQSLIGMAPQLLSREFWPSRTPRELSLLTVWHDVRDWRHELNDAEAASDIQLVHAHSFPSAMAGIRGTLPLVYEFTSTIDQVAATQAVSGPWLVRSLRVAEQFVLSRAGAVVTRSSSMHKTAMERGTLPENLFTIPEPVPAEDPLVNSTNWALQHHIHQPNGPLFIGLPDGVTGAEFILRAFAAMLPEVQHAILLLESNQPEEARRLLRDLNLSEAVRVFSPSERTSALSCADVVIAHGSSDASGCNRSLLRALAYGRPVIATDLPENRECAPEGQGCIWYASGDAGDLVRRARFIAGDKDFCRSLGESGREFIRTHRSATAIARRYDAVYRHAIARRSERLPRIPMPKLYALGEA